MNPADFTAHYHSRGLDAPLIHSFRSLVLHHYRHNQRPMPWRETRDPYAILVSEVMLQQTQVERVKGKFAEFMARFPDVATLASAPLLDVLAVWQGLGYNRRAIALKRCAEAVAEEFGGIFPGSPEELQTLPGIGPYTAGALAAFAFQIPTPMVETNIRTVFLHFFFQGQAGVTDLQILPLVEATLDRADPRQWYYALMDYGAMLKKQHVNPGRRSAHHAVQSPFKGSNRELRSRMLRAIMAEPGITLGRLAHSLTADIEKLKSNLEVLQREGFIMMKGRGFQVSA